jgi:hypothetical protein
LRFADAEQAPQQYSFPMKVLGRLDALVLHEQSNLIASLRFPHLKSLITA